jgi:hypothetical protein
MHYTPPIISQYVRRIRNTNKRRYAGEYVEYLKGLVSEPEAKCSVMAAQGVRLQLHALWAQCHSTK